MLVIGQVVGGIPGSVPLVGLVIGCAFLGIGALRGDERVTVGSLVGVVGIVSTFAVLPQSAPRAAETVWRGEVEEVPRYPKTGAISLLIRGVPNEGGEAQSPPTRLACTAVDLPWRNIAGIERGDLLIFRAMVTPLEFAVDPFAYANLLRRRGVSASCRITHATPVLDRERLLVERVRSAIERRVKRVVGGGEMGGLLLAMSIGARDTLSIDTERAFKATGLSHLLVVSGFQVTLAYYLVSAGVLGVLQRLGRGGAWLPGRVVARTLGVAASLVFVAVSGLDGSSLRAAVAVVFTVVARALERGGGLFNGVVVSLLAISLVWPGAVLEPGVELTYAALLGICLGRNIFPPRAGIVGNISTVAGVTLGVWLLSSIVSLGWFRTFSPLGLVLNPFLAPLLGVLGCHGTVAGLAAQWSGLDPTGILLQGVGGALIVGRNVVAHIAQSGLVVPELSPAVAALWALILGVLSASLLHRQGGNRTKMRRGVVSGEARDGGAESRLSESDRSATLFP